MYKRLIAALVIVSFAMLSGLKTASANAYFASSNVTCSSFSATGTVTTTYVAVRIWNKTKGQYDGTSAIIDSYLNVGAPTAYFAAPGGIFSFTVSFPAQPTGDVLVARIYATNTPAFLAWDNGTFPQVLVSCVPNSPGPLVPAGFVIRTIVCTVAVFDTPAGHPVGDNKLTAGQTWFVNPTPVKGKDGKWWTEFFDAGYTDGYIPTSCVG